MEKPIGLLATGNELVEGDILNTNGQYIAQNLLSAGLPIGMHLLTSDDKNEIETGIKFLLEYSSSVIITGGLGPTSDDRTRFALSEVIQQSLIFDEASWQQIEIRVQERLKRAPHPSNRQQALFPQEATIFPNMYGTAAGCHATFEHKNIFMLPGPPKECHPMFDDYVMPILKSQYPASKKAKLSWHLQGVSESEIAATIDEALKIYPVITGYRAHSPNLEIKVYTERHDNYDEMIAVIEGIVEPYLIKK